MSSISNPTAAFGVVFFLVSAGAASAKTWPQYHGPNTDNTTTEMLPLDSWKTASAPKEVWRIETNTGFSSFTVASGKALTIVRRDIDGIEREVCIALDASTGKELWASPLTLARYGHDGGNAGAKGNKGGDGPRSTPTIDGNRVFVTDADLKVYAFNLSDGEQLWGRDIEKEHGGKNIKWKNAASPLVEGDLVLLAGGGRGQALLGLDNATGKTVWKGEDDEMTHATPIATSIHGTRQVIFFTQEGLVSVEPGNGNVLWRYPFDFKVSTGASPVVSGDIVFCSAGYGVGAGACRVSKIGGKFEAKEIWRTENKNINHWSTPVVKDGYLYGMFSFKKYGEGPVSCVDIRTGEMKWEEPGFGQGNLILAGSSLLALSDKGELVAIDPSPEGYQEKRRHDVLDGKCWSTPVLADGRVYARSTTEGACFDLR